MTAAIIIIICSLLLIAYVFDLTASKTRIPGVVLLLVLGWGVRQAVKFFEINVPDLSPLLPILGTVGLILIVLEGSLELEFNRSKLPLIRRSFAMALVPIIIVSLSLGYLFFYFSGATFKDSLLNAIPLSVISSSIAIPSMRHQARTDREFVTYESSLSDILGILFFNFLAFNTVINFSSFGSFALELLIMGAISFLATLALAFLLSKIDHHIKFMPIIILVILVYEIAKVYNLPALLFILLFGLFLGNLDELKRFKFVEKLRPDELNLEVHKFKDLITEATFLVRTLFFLLFGYLMKTSEIIDTKTLAWTAVVVAIIFICRAVLLKILRFKLLPLVFVAPRGLINILLFLSILPENAIGIVNKSLLVQVVFVTAIIMMIGLIISKNEPAEQPVL
jgi:potassium/hydrogen antiporter